MKPNPSEARSCGDMPASLAGVLEKRSRRTLAQAASQLARSMVGGTLGGSSLKGSARGPSASSAAASVQRLRKVLERDRTTFAAQEPEISEASVVSVHDEPTRVRRPPVVMERHDRRASALAAAAASAFGSTSAGESPGGH
jgi:hypothetical protein